MNGLLAHISRSVVFFMLTACASMPTIPPDRATGWISDDAFCVRAVGTAKYEVADLQVRKQQALQSAMLMARYIVFEALTAEIAWDAGHLPRKEIFKRVKNEFGNFVKAGNAVEIKYNEEGICSVLFEIRGENIKQKFYALRNRMMVENR